jgi:uncharacterized protein with HEPN domain
MRRDDFIRLRHMLDASQEAISFAEGKKRADLDHDRMLVLSLVKEIEIIGEAATKVSEDCRREHPEIPWKNIRYDAEPPHSRLFCYCPKIQLA